jgi:ubiquitin-protein ligase
MNKNRHFIKKLIRELDDIKSEEVNGIIAHPKDEMDFSELICSLSGECIKGTPYEDGKFFLNIQFPESYPFKPLKIKFLTQIYHCNITKDGRISLNILYDDWSPGLTLKYVLKGICFLLKYPNPDNPIIPEIANLYKKNKLEHDKQAAKYTYIHAKIN